MKVPLYEYPVDTVTTQVSFLEFLNYSNFYVSGGIYSKVEKTLLKKNLKPLSLNIILLIV